MNKENGRKYALWGAWLQVGAVIGLIWTVIGMISSFQNVSPSGTALANGISNELTPVLIASVASFIGVILLAVALFRKKYRAAWASSELIGRPQAGVPAAFASSSSSSF